MSDPIQSPSTPSTPSLGGAGPTEPRPMENEYQPLSGLSLGAIGVASLFAVLMVALTVTAFVTGKPVVWWALLLLPTVGLILSILARVQIDRSAGTRAGLALSNTAWWICVVGGVVYLAYLLGNIYVIGGESRVEAEAWFAHIKDGDYGSAFVTTLEPVIRAGVSPSDLAGIEARFGATEWPSFRQSPFIQLCERNAEHLEITHDARSDLQQTQTGYDVVQRYRLTCPEGTFIVPVRLVAIESDDFDSRQWQIPFGSAMLTESKLTPYGRMVAELRSGGGQSFGLFIQAVRTRNGPTALLMTQPSVEWAKLAVFPAAPVTRDPARTDPNAFLASDFFQTPAGNPPSATARQFLRESWFNGGFTAPGGPSRTVDDDPRIELILDGDDPVIRVSTSILIQNPANTQFIKGRLLTVCRDPDVIERVREAREAGKANPNDFYESDLSPLAEYDVDWQVERLVSDFQIRAMSEMMGAMDPAEMN